MCQHDSLVLFQKGSTVTVLILCHAHICTCTLSEHGFSEDKGWHCHIYKSMQQYIIGRWDVNCETKDKRVKEKWHGKRWNIKVRGGRKLEATECMRVQKLREDKCGKENDRQKEVTVWLCERLQSTARKITCRRSPEHLKTHQHPHLSTL